MHAYVRINITTMQAHHWFIMFSQVNMGTPQGMPKSALNDEELSTLVVNGPLTSVHVLKAWKKLKGVENGSHLNSR